MQIELPLSRLKPSTLNPRKHFAREDLAQLSDSIAKHGVLTNLIVRPESCVGLITANDLANTRHAIDGNGAFEIVSGERRYHAAFAATQMGDGLLVPCRVKAMTDPEVLAINLTEQMQRSELTPLEEADAFAQMLAFQDEHGKPLHTVETLAESVSKEHDYVLGRLKLKSAPAVLKKALDEGKVPARVVELVARVPSAAEREEAGKLALSGGRDGAPMTVVETAAMLEEKFMVQLKGAPFDQEDGSLVADAGACSVCPHRTGNNKEFFGSVKRGDICANPSCYRAKCAAMFAVLASEATAKGVLVLTDAESAKLFETHQPTTLRYNGDYVELDTRPLPHLLKPEITNAPMWREIATKADAAGMNPKTVLAKDGAGRGRWLGESKLLMAASEKLGEPIFVGQGEDAPDVAPRPGEDANDTFNRGKREHAEKLKAEADAAAKKKKEDALVRVAAVRAVWAGLADQWTLDAIWNVLLGILAVPENPAACTLAMELLELKPNATEKQITAEVKKLQSTYRQALVPMLLSARAILDRGVLCETLRALAQHAGVNLNAIEKEALAKAKPAKAKPVRRAALAQGDLPKRKSGGAK
jgi:ParB-like chromosome segregation protein Spo0J